MGAKIAIGDSTHTSPLLCSISLHFKLSEIHAFHCQHPTIDSKSQFFLESIVNRILIWIYCRFDWSKIYVSLLLPGSAFVMPSKNQKPTQPRQNPRPKFDLVPPKCIKKSPKNDSFSAQHMKIFNEGFIVWNEVLYHKSASCHAPFERVWIK